VKGSRTCSTMLPLRENSSSMGLTGAARSRQRALDPSFVPAPPGAAGIAGEGRRASCPAFRGRACYGRTRYVTQADDGNGPGWRIIVYLDSVATHIQSRCFAYTVQRASLRRVSTVLRPGPASNVRSGSFAPRPLFEGMHVWLTQLELSVGSSAFVLPFSEFHPAVCVYIRRILRIPVTHQSSKCMFIKISSPSAPAPRRWRHLLLPCQDEARATTESHDGEPRRRATTESHDGEPLPVT